MSHAHPKPERRGLRHIDGTFGWPVLGESIPAVRHTLAFWRAKFGTDVSPYRTEVFGEPAVAFAGPEAAQRILTDPHQDLSSEGGWDHTLGRFFHGGLMLRDFDDHRTHRRLMQRAFSRSAIQGYLTVLHHSHALTAVDLPLGVAFDPWVALKQPLLETASRVFLGGDARQQAEINAAFLDVLSCVGALVRVPLPGTRWARADRGRRRLVQAYRAVVAERRARPGTDLCSRLVQHADGDEELLDDEAVVDHLIFVMMAAHDTTNSALSSLLVFLALHPEWQDRVRHEVRALPASPSPEDLDTLDVTRRCIREALRLNPPVVAIPRRTVRPCTITGIDLPANAQIWLNVVMTHRHPAFWSDPDRFDPDRFAPPRDEHRQARFVYVPYGGGAHTCLGMAFADLSMQIFVAAVLRDSRLELLPGWSPRWDFLPFPRARGPVPLRRVAASD